jgi:hypothetical protein
MAIGAALVWVVTSFSAAMGPRLSGLLAMFPVMGSVLVVFSHRQSGALFVIKLLRGMVLGYYAFGAFCAVLAYALPRLRIELAFLAALLVALVIQAGTSRQLQRRKFQP